MAEISVDELLQTALAHHQAGRRIEAEKLYRQILAQNPDHDGALNLLSVIARQAGHAKAAVELARRAVALNPGVAGYHANLGAALHDQGEFDPAIAAFRHALALDRDFPPAHYNLSNTLLEKEYATPAELDEAAAASRRALRLQPDNASAATNLGIALHRKGEYKRSICACNHAIKLRPDYADAHNNLANALKDSGQFAQAIAAYRQAIRLKPNFPDAHYNLAAACLLTGDFEEGWVEHEWRLKNPRTPAPTFPQPRWDGKPLNGQTLLLHGEQGLGETIQFARYALLAAERGARTLIQCQPELVSLLRSNPALGHIVPMGDPLPPFDFHFPLLSLPLLFKTDLSSIPASVPYLMPDRARVAAWREKLAPPGDRLRVGLIWAGNPRFKDDRTRSLTLDRLAPFAAANNVHFHALQKGAAAAQADHPPAGLSITPLGPQLTDFADTAAVMSVMDLIVTTDTSAAHLAGALGRPTWLMLQFVPDFRWLLDRLDSPWYPTMRLFRQTSHGAWDDLLQRVADELVSLSRGKNETGLNRRNPV